MTNTRTPPTVIMSSAALTMPTAEQRRANKKAGGNKTLYDVASLVVGRSLAVIGRTAKQLGTTITSANKREYPAGPRMGADGKPMKGDDGKVIVEPATRKFFAVDCDPATDPDKATARIWREA